ncbi:MAG TPA: alpha/beta hydrolase [Candidatus Tumulicola sp.]
MRLMLLSLLAFAALFAANPAARPVTPRFETSACPKTAEPMKALSSARCGFLIVPENRSKPNGRTIRLAVAILPAQQSPSPMQSEPIAFMAGGPGEAAILDAPFLVDAGINRKHDVVIMNQRGTLFDDPDLNCPELDRFYARQVSLVYDAPSTGKAQAAAAAACHKRLVGMGADLSAYNTTENEQDFVDLRQALGYKQWDLYGYSYGTDLALSMMRDHPQGIHQVVLDSVVPPNIVGLVWTWGSAREGLTTLFNDCKSQPKCNSKYPNLLATFTRVVRQLEAHPIVRNVVPPGGKTPVKVVLDGGTIITMAVSNAPKAPYLPRAITELAHGNPKIFLETRATAAHVAEVPEQALGMTQSFICREWVPYGSPTDILLAGKAEFPDFPDSVLINAPQMPFQHEMCAAWNVPTGPSSQRVRVHSDIRTLVVSGAIDAKTGAKWGRYAADTLPNSTYVRMPAFAHWVIVQSSCGQQIFQNFVSPPGGNKTCAATAPRVDFK